MPEVSVGELDALRKAAAREDLVASLWQSIKTMEMRIAEFEQQHEQPAPKRTGK